MGEWEAAITGVLWKEVFLEISQNSQENTCAKVSFLIKLWSSDLQISCRPQTCNLIKKETLAQVFPVNFAKFIRTPFYRTRPDGCFWRRMNFLLMKYHCQLFAIWNSIISWRQNWQLKQNKTFPLLVFLTVKTVLFNLPLWSAVLRLNWIIAATDYHITETKLLL